MRLSTFRTEFVPKPMTIEMQLDRLQTNDDLRDQSAPGHQARRDLLFGYGLSALNRFTLELDTARAASLSALSGDNLATATWRTWVSRK
jgi:hypothetical protein